MSRSRTTEETAGRKLTSAVSRGKLISTGDSVLVAVSGGADSVALLHLLLGLKSALNLEITVAHLHHNIRGRAATLDQSFVRKLARRLKVAFVTRRVDVPALAQASGISIEMAARSARYDFLTREARLRKAIIVTAHTANDQAETMLLKFARGAGTRGLSGINPNATMDGVRVVRPLLDVSRAEIEAYLTARKLRWREDESNADTAYLRNRVRHELLPLLARRLNPDLVTTLSRTASIIRTEDQFLDQLAIRNLKSCKVNVGSLSVKRLAKLPPAILRRLIRAWLAGEGFPPELVDFDSTARIETLLQDRNTTGRCELAAGHHAAREYDRLFLIKPMAAESRGFEAVVNIPGITRIPRAGLVIKTRIAAGVEKSRPDMPGKLPAAASLNLHGNTSLIIRSWKPGDRMRPFGMTGTKKLQDIFSDLKVPRSKRSKVPVLVCNGEIIWIPGYRIAGGWEITDPASPSLQISVAAG